MPNNEVYDIFQDSKGFIWIGTLNGLCRFDGVRFEKFESQQQKGPHLSKITEDSEGKIWASNFNGQLFYVQDGKLKEFTKWDGIQFQGFDRYNVSEPEKLLVTDVYKLHSYHFPDSVWEPVEFQEPSKNFPFLNTSVIIRQNDSTIWIPFKNRGFSFYRNGKLFSPKYSNEAIKYFQKPNGKSVVDFRAFNINNEIWFADTYNNAIFSTKGDSIIYDSKINREFSPLLSGFINVSSTKNGLIWFSNNKKMTVYNSDLTINHSFEGKLPAYRISKTLLDREGSYWFSTLENGIFQIKNFEITVFNEKSKSIPQNYITHIKNTGNDQLIFSDKSANIFRFNYRTFKMENIYSGGGIREFQSMTFNRSTNSIYFSTEGLFRFDIAKKTRKNIFEFMSVKDIEFDSFGNLFLASPGFNAVILKRNSSERYSGLVQQFNRKSRFSETGDSIFVFDSDRSNSIYFDETKQKIFLGNNTKLAVFDSKGRREVNDENGNPIIARTFSGEINGGIWVGTQNQGLFLLDDEKVKLHLTVKDGLKSNTIRKIIQDSSELWIGTTNGLHRFNLVENKIYAFNTLDGLPTNDIFSFALSEEDVWIATSKGLVRFPKKFNGYNEIPSPVFISDVTVNGLSIFPVKNSEFNYDENNFVVTFQSPSYKSSGQFSFIYRLSGINEEWIPTSSASNFARFSSLPPGNYTFQVIAENEDGVRSEKPDEMSFVINPPFWKTWWFILLISAFAAALAVFYFDRKIKKMKSDQQLQHDRELADHQLRISQLNAIKSQMNPHFMFNALNSIQSLVFQNDKKQANMFLGKFSDLMRMVLDLSNRQFVSLSEELRLLNLYLELEALRFEDELKYFIEVASDIQTDQIEIPSLLIQPYVENAIKHGLLHKKNNCRLTIVIKKDTQPNVLLVTVSDNGVGRQEAENIKKRRGINHISFATGANEKRLELLNFGKQKYIGVEIADKQDSYGNATGTAVTIRIPVNDGRYFKA